jgi:cell division septation protein DedD
MRTFAPPVVAAILLLATGADVLPAQDAAPSPAVLRVVARARGLIENGAGADARALLDSLVVTLAPASADLAEALYWRATLAERLSESERDWKRLPIEAPLSLRAADALVRLGELELLRGRPGTARPYFERVEKDFPETPQRAKATLWVVRSHLDERNAAAACAALGTLPLSAVPDGELRLQHRELGKGCRGTGAVGANGAGAKSAGAKSASANGASSKDASSKAANPKAADPKDANPNDVDPKDATASETGRYSVQLAAYDTRAEAEAAAKRLSTRGISARVDGEVKPFRVRTGRFATRAEANALLVKLKRQGMAGFIAELRP